MAEEQAKTTGRCYGCRRVFTFDPAEVTMFLVDPQTGLPPGFTVLGRMRPASPEAVARSADQPVCPGCVTRAKQFGQADSPPAGLGDGPPSVN
jgi:hypothetical protein